MKAAVRTISYIVLCAILLCLFSCGQKEVVAPPDVQDFFDALRRRDYSYCYSVLDGESKGKMTLSQFVSRYDTIYSAMGLLEVEYAVSRVSYDDASCTVDCSVFYTCDKLGEISQEITVNLVREGGLWRVSWRPSMIFADLEEGDTVAVNTLRQKRGEILDAEGNVYAANAYADTIYVDLEDVGDYGRCAKSLSELTGMAELDILKIMSSDRSQADGIAVVTYYVPGVLTAYQKEAFRSVQGVGIDSVRYTQIRYYPQGSLMSHTVGYATIATAEDLETKSSEVYGADSYIGRTGLEAAYEETLAGRRGIELVIRTPDEKDADGNVISYSRKSVIKRVEAVDGTDLCLTVDLTLQKRAETLLASYGVIRSASVVILDPTTGAVLAAASYPTFSSNIFADKNVAEYYNALLEDKNAPLYNRTTRGLYPPGSTVKPFVGAMAIDSGLFSLSTLFKGTIYKRQWMPTMEGWVYPAITRVSDYAQPYNMTNAIIHSDNIYFANVALTTGWTRMVGLYTALGFDAAIDYDLNVAAPSIYSDASWSNLRLLADMGYGQGELLITPIQMASLYEIFVNGGKIMAPYIVGELRQTVGGRYVTTETFSPRVWRENVLMQGTVASIEAVLEQTIQRTSSTRIEGILTAGKTGTAEVDDHTEIAWLIEYVKDTEYERLICITLETAPEEGTIRHEIAKELLMP